MEVTITNDNFESYKNGELPLVVDSVSYTHLTLPTIA